MKTSNKIAIALSLASVLSACTFTPKTVPLDKALNNLESELKKSGVVTFTGDSFYPMAKAAQCFHETKNPIIPILTKEISLSLLGGFSETGSFSIGAVTTVPVLGFSGGATANQQQTILIPLSHVPLASVWLVYLQQNLAYFSGVPDSDLKKDGIQHIIDKSAMLKKQGEQLINEYNKEACIKIKKDLRIPLYSPYNLIIKKEDVLQ